MPSTICAHSLPLSLLISVNVNIAWIVIVFLHVFLRALGGMVERGGKGGGLFSLFFSIIFGGAVHAVLHNFVSSALLKSCGSLFFHLAYILARYLLYYQS